MEMRIYFTRKLDVEKSQTRKYLESLFTCFLSVSDIYAIILITEIGFETDTMQPQKQVQEQRV